MESPGRQGASRTIGGTFRGNAHGNAPKAADLRSSSQYEYVGKVTGKAMLYVSSADPTVLRPEKMSATASLKLDVTDQTIGSVVTQIADRWSPIKRAFFLQLDFDDFQLLILI